MPGDVRQLQSFVKGSHSFVSRHASAVIEIIRQSKEKALRELQESLLEPEEGELTGESPREDIVSDEMNSEVSIVTHSLQTNETLRGVDEEGRMESSKSSKTLQTENLVTSMGTRTDEPLASETTGSDKAGHSFTHSRSEDGQSKLTSDDLTGPVVVSRKTISSFFNRKSGKTTSVPLLPSSNVPVSPKARDGTFEAQDSPRQLSMGQVLRTDSSLQSLDQAMPDACSDERNTTTLDEEQGLDQAQERTVSESLTAKVVVTSVEIQAAGAVSSATVEAVYRAGDEPFTVPGTSPLQVTEGEGKTPQIEVTATSVDESIIPASVVIEKVSENTSIMQAKKKPSKLGAWLAGRKRVPQTGPSESAKEVEQVNFHPAIWSVIGYLFLCCTGSRNGLL